jgi:hypothetical protein
MLASLILAAALGGEAALPDEQDSRGAPCRSGKTAFGHHCDACGRTLGDLDMREGRCKRCDGEPRKFEYCVKRLKPFFLSSCMHRRKMDRPFKCCGKVHAAPTYPEDRARVTYACRTCGAKADARADLRHAGTCDNAFAVDRLCAKSGIPPHVN